MKKETQTTPINEKVNNFIQKNRTAFFIVLIVIGVAFIGFLLSYSVFGALRKNENRAIEELLTRYEALKGIDDNSLDTGEDAINDNADSSNDADSSTDEDTSNMDSFVSDMKAFAEKVKASSYAGGKAYGVLAEIYGKKNQLADAQAAWVNAAKKARKSYLAPLSWYNAAVAAEEQGNYEQAIDYYAKSIGSNVGSLADFPAAVIAQFSIGRLREETGDIDGAIEAYRILVSAWGVFDFSWANMARSRITALELGKK